MKDVPNHVDGPHTPQRAAFAKSMCDGAESINLDPDVNSFCAYALMNQSPWNYYEGSNAGSHFPLKDFLIPAKEMLLTTINQTIEKNGLPHPLAVHLYGNDVFLAFGFVLWIFFKKYICVFLGVL